MNHLSTQHSSDHIWYITKLCRRIPLFIHCKLYPRPIVINRQEYQTLLPHPRFHPANIHLIFNAISLNYQQRLPLLLPYPPPDDMQSPILWSPSCLLVLWLSLRASSACRLWYWWSACAGSASVGVPLVLLVHEESVEKLGILLGCWSWTRCLRGWLWAKHKCRFIFVVLAWSWVCVWRLIIWWSRTEDVSGDCARHIYILDLELSASQDIWHSLSNVSHERVFLGENS